MLIIIEMTGGYGLTLPLMSYGGSGIVTNCLAIALLLRVDFENRCLMVGRKS